MVSISTPKLDLRILKTNQIRMIILQPLLSFIWFILSFLVSLIYWGYGYEPERSVMKPLCDLILLETTKDHTLLWARGADSLYCYGIVRNNSNNQENAEKKKCPLNINWSSGNERCNAMTLKEVDFSLTGQIQELYAKQALRTTEWCHFHLN